MAAVFVHVGQCGNQVGSSFYELTHQSKETESLFTAYDGKLRSVHVDGEKKVVKKLTSGKKKLAVRECNVITRKQGCASNWAMGYFGPRGENSNSLVTESLEAIRREVERCDRFSGFIQMHSLGGGTGSGAGSSIIERLRDYYPLAYILSCAVAPHQTGESPLQHYNSLMSMTWLQRYSDGVLLLQNDDILHSLIKTHELQNSKEPVSVRDMNRTIAESLAGILLPVDELNPHRGIYSGQEPWELIRSVCPMPACKFMSVNSVIRSKVSWQNIAKNVVHQARKYDKEGKPFYSLSNLVVARGDTTHSFPASIDSIQKIIKAAYHSVSWNPFPVDFWKSSRQEFMKPGEASVTICRNSSIINELAIHTYNKAKMMYDAKAFLHWYERYHSGFKDSLSEAFEEMQEIINNYNAAIK